MRHAALRGESSAGAVPSSASTEGQSASVSACAVGGDSAAGQALGRAWVLGDPAGLPKVSKMLLPLWGLVRLATRDAARARAGRGVEVRGSLGRQWLLLKAIALGR